ncbi:MAG: hypothetical protein HYX51_03265, partial [Chloroflexi bacterium]|nr:hypothetical protein [Chloroflexota bacterium]
AHEQVAYLRATPNEQLVVAVNAADKAADVKIALPGARRARLVDVLDSGRAVPMEDGSATLRVPSRWARVLRVESNRRSPGSG